MCASLSAYVVQLNAPSCQAMETQAKAASSKRASPGSPSRKAKVGWAQRQDDTNSQRFASLLCHSLVLSVASSVCPLGGAELRVLCRSSKRRKETGEIVGWWFRFCFRAVTWKVAGPLCFFSLCAIVDVSFLLRYCLSV